MTIQQELDIAAIFGLIAAAGSIFSALRTPAGGRRTYFVVFAAFCLLIGINAATSSWQRTLSIGTQGALATSYLVLVLVVGFLMIFSSKVLRKSVGREPKTPEGR